MRGVDESFYAELIRDLSRPGAQAVLDLEGQPLRLGVEASRTSSPTSARPSTSSARSSEDEEDFFDGAFDTMAELGARNVHITPSSSRAATPSSVRTGR